MRVIGYGCCYALKMFGNELKTKIEQLEHELIIQNEEYVAAVRSHKDYNTLRSIRETIRGLKDELDVLYHSTQPD